MATSLRRHLAAALAFGGLLIAPPALASPSETACGYLAELMTDAPPGPVFLASYPTVEQGPLHAAAFLYDNAAAAIALIGCGRADQAARIGDAMVAALDRDRHWHDGRLRNGYAAGAVGPGPVKLSGWWDQTQNRWVEDRYQVGSDTGNMAWAMLALLALNRDGDGPQYLAAAARIGHWVEGRRSQVGPGGFTGGTFGHEPDPAGITWKSTEHNTDLAAAFTGLAQLSGDGAWRQDAEAAASFVRAMWDPACNCFATGTGEDGITLNRFLALDAQIWPLLAVPGAASQYAGALTAAKQRLSFGEGFAYSQVRDGLWIEGTAQVALLARLQGRTDDAQRLSGAIEAQRTPDGGYYATTTPNLPTGFMLQTDPSKPRLYFRLPHLGAAAWAAMAETGFNPFTGTRGLPPTGR